MTTATRALSVPIQGMSWVACVAHVESALEEPPSVVGVAVKLATNKASQPYDPARVSVADLARAIDEVGNAVASAEVTLPIRGVTCPSWVAHVEGASAELASVTGVVVNVGLSTARIAYIPGLVNATALKRPVRDAGYEAQGHCQGANAVGRERKAREEKIKRQGRHRIASQT